MREGIPQRHTGVWR